jgi:hypothetical protein
MNPKSKHRQAGASVLGLIVVLGLVGIFVVTGARVLPSYLEYQGVQRAAEKARSGTTPEQIRAAFDRAAQVDNVTSIRGADLEVTKNEAGEVVVRFAYDREFPLGGPASLKIRYEGQVP